MTAASPAHVARAPGLRAAPLRALLVVGVLALEVLAGHVSITQSPAGDVAMFWPTAGLSVAALCLAAPEWRRWVLGGIVLAVLAANLSGGRAADVSAAFALANAAGAATALGVLARGGRSRPELLNLEDFFRLVLGALAGATVTAAGAGLAVATLVDGDPFAASRTMVTAHAAAIMLITPLAMRLPRHAKRAGRVESTLQWSALLAVLLVIFQPDQTLPLAFLPFPLLVWGAARFSPREVTVQLLCFFTLVCSFTIAGIGPMATHLATHGAGAELVGTLLQAQVLAAVLVALPLSLVKTQQQVTFDRLTRSHALVSNILDSTTGTAILGTDREGRIEFFNIGAERMTGYRAAEVIGRATLALVDFGDGRLRITVEIGEEPDPSQLEELIGPFLDGADTAFSSDWDFVHRNGEIRTISVAISRRCDEQGRHIGYLGVADDVTDRRRHEAMVAAALEAEKQVVDRLAQVDQTKNDFISTVSHELRTPITSILGYSQLLLSDDSGTLPAMHQQLVGRIERNGRRLMGLIEDMLTMSQVEVGTFSFDRSPIDLRDAVLNAVDAVRTLVAVHALALDVEVGPEAVQVNGDPDKLERVFVNLLSNAAKFSHAGDRIGIRLGAEGDEAVLSVVDTGIGIGPEDRLHLFDRFFRGADAHALAIQGAGLGLPVAGSIVAGHDGRIDVDSELGRGSTFVVRLPLLRSTAGAATAVAHAG